MKRLLLIICSISLINANSANAADVVLLESGSSAPFRGYLFPEDKALDLRKQLLDLDSLKSVQSSYDRSIALYKKGEALDNDKINLLIDQNDKLAKSLSSTTDRNAWENVMWFGFGVVATGLGVYAARQTLR